MLTQLSPMDIVLHESSIPQISTIKVVSAKLTRATVSQCLEIYIFLFIMFYMVYRISNLLLLKKSSSHLVSTTQKLPFYQTDLGENDQLICSSMGPTNLVAASLSCMQR